MPKTTFKILLTFLFFAQTIAHAQDTLDNAKKQRFVGIDAGTTILFSKTPEYDFIRGDVLPYSSGGASETLKGFISKYHLGLNTEFRDKNYRWSFLIGLRYTRMNINLGKESIYGSTSKYFYLLDNQSVTTTEYFRVKEINRTIDFIGIPIELRWNSNSLTFFKLYFKLGLECDYKINTSSEVVFYDENMSEYSDLVLGKFENPKSFYSGAYLSAGFNFNKIPNIDLELVYPYIVLTHNTTGILKSNSGLGLSIEIRLPY